MEKCKEEYKWGRDGTARQHSDRRASCSRRKLLAPPESTPKIVSVSDVPRPRCFSHLCRHATHTHTYGYTLYTRTRRDARGGPRQGRGVDAHTALVEASASPRCGAYLLLPLRGTRKRPEGNRRKLAGVGTL